MFWPLAQGGKANFAALADVPRLREADRKTGGTNSKTTTSTLYPIKGKIQRKKRHEKRSKRLIILALLIHEWTLLGMLSTERMCGFGALEREEKSKGRWLKILKWITQS
jgi:hypothetical protein